MLSYSIYIHKEATDKRQENCPVIPSPVNGKWVSRRTFLKSNKTNFLVTFQNTFRKTSINNSGPLVVFINPHSVDNTAHLSVMLGSWHKQMFGFAASFMPHPWCLYSGRNINVLTVQEFKSCWWRPSSLHWSLLTWPPAWLASARVSRPVSTGPGSLAQSQSPLSLHEDDLQWNCQLGFDVCVFIDFSFCCRI